MIALKLGKGNLSLDKPQTVKEILTYLKENMDKAKELGVQGILNDVIAADFNGKLIDLSFKVAENGNLKFFNSQSAEGLDTLRHSASHIMAQAVLRLYPNSKLGIGPTIQDGFYYDIETSSPINEPDLARIEEEMNKIVEENFEFSREDMDSKKASGYFKSVKQSYKVELIKDIASDKVSLYKQGEFTDLCRGPHIPSTKYLKAFKLLSVSGAYWRGSEKNAMLTRIYGTAFPDRKELQQHIAMLEEAKKRDHRKLGRELDLFSIDDQIGGGLVLWHPKGGRIRYELEQFWREEHYRNGYELVFTPHIGRGQLWETSGHLGFYNENMYSPMDIDGQPFYVKPMNCPFHIAIYKTKAHSYRDLPYRWAELGTVYRYERSGVLHGLMRVRGFTQDDAHIFCTPEQMPEEIDRTLSFCLKMIRSFGFNDFKLYLATRPNDAVGDPERWDAAIKSLKEAIERTGLPSELDEGGGAFYGPKIDLKIKDALGREWQCSTIQFDFNEPERFKMTYTGSDGADHQPYMIHRALFGSIERFFGVLIEHYAGKFPLWLSPVQVTLLPVSDKFNEYAKKIEQTLIDNKIRVESDLTPEKLGYKIRKAQMLKIPYMLIVGEKEAETKTISLRHRDKGDLGTSTLEEFLKNILEENIKRV